MEITQICLDCAMLRGMVIPENHVYSAWIDKCDVCKEIKDLASPSDFKTLSREDLRLEMCKYQSIASKYRDAIDRIDKEEKLKTQKSLVGKCYKGEYEWVRIEGTKETDLQYYCTRIVQYSSMKMGIDHNADFWQEDDLNGLVEISNIEFLEKLKAVLNELDELVIR